jgi:photosystem II stability/assembly factor-like uncharacterized protein
MRRTTLSLLMIVCAAVMIAAVPPAAPVSAGQAASQDQPWIKMDSRPNVDNLNAVHASSKKSVWFAGDNGTILKWDGKTFTPYKVELPDGVRLMDIHMFTAENGWAVGYNTANNYGRLYRWDGRSWKLFTEEGIRGTKFAAIDFLGLQDGLAAGEEGHLYRWDGRTWADKSSEIWSTSGVTQSRLSRVSDIAADPERSVYLIACSYKTHLDPPRTDSVYVNLDLKVHPAKAFYNSPVLDGIATSPGSRLFTVPGGKAHYLSGKTVYTFSPNNATYQKAGIRQYAFNLNDGSLRGLWLFGKNDGWFAGDGGAVIRLQPGPEAKTYRPVSDRLNAIWMLDKDFGFIAGDRGTVLMRNTTAGVELDLGLSQLEYDSGQDVFAGVTRLSQATSVAMPLTGAAWEVRKEVATADEGVSLRTVYTKSLTPRSRADNQSLDYGEMLTLTWNQKNDNGRQVEPGYYRLVFRLGDKQPAFRFLIRQPTGPITSSDTPDGQGGFSLDLKPTYINLLDVTFKLINHNTRSITISGASYSIAIQREDGWHSFYDSGTRGFHPGTIAAGQAYEWSWNRFDTRGFSQADVGRYKLTVKLPGQTPPELSQEFEIKRRG